MHPHAQVLAMLAIKIYSIAINSMADKRTQSNFTWFNSALRNCQEVKTLVDMIQVCQWYLNVDRTQPTRMAPTVRWADFDRSMSESREMAEDDLEDEEFFGEWPANNSGKPSKQVELQDDYFKMDPQMNLSSATLRTLLCERREDEESDSDSEINGGSEGSGKGGSCAEDSESDIDEDDDEVWDF